MIKETSKCNNNSRGWEALEEKLKGRGMTIAEIQEARKSFYDGIEVLFKMFMQCEQSVHGLESDQALKNNLDKVG